MALTALGMSEAARSRQARYRYTREEFGRVWLALDGENVIEFQTNKGMVRRALLGEEPRVYYRITSFGPAVARAEVRRLQQLVRHAQARGLTPRLAYRRSLACGGRRRRAPQRPSTT